MTLKTKLLLAQSPLALALLLLGVLSAFVTARLGEEASGILAQNYRSVLAAQRMKEAVERLDSLALMALTEPTRLDPEALLQHQRTIEGELRVEEDNITEPGEAAAAAKLRQTWMAYRDELAAFRAGSPETRKAGYFAALAPSFAALKAAADEILAINQDAMARKAQRAQRRADWFQSIVIGAVLGLCALGLIGSVALISRLLRPVGIVAAAVRRFGTGDVSVRARVGGHDEIAQLASEFNGMAETLERYRASSLGELIEAQESAQAAMDALPDPVVLVSSAGALTGHNQAATSVLGIDLELLPPKDAFAGVDPAIRAALDRFRTHVVAGRGTYVPKGFEEAIRVATPEGERVFVPRAAPIYGESGAVTGTAAVFQDVTRLFRADELKNDLVATVAHEFRTPLTSLRMAIHLCVEGTVGSLTPKQADLLFGARDDCERLQTIVDDLLNLSRIESGRIDLHRRRVSPESLVELAIGVHRLAAQDRHVTLRAEVLPGLPEVFVDPDRLQLVFTNLLSNAIRYSPEGGEIVVRALPAPDEVASGGARQVRFEVADQGPGVPPEHRPGLFEKFFRVPGSPAGGSGLGLFIAKGLVQAHRGRIGLAERGRGATFWFTVPAAPDLRSAADHGP